MPTWEETVQYIASLAINNPDAGVIVDALQSQAGQANSRSVLLVAQATFDPHTDAALRTIGTHALPLPQLPQGAVVVRSWVSVPRTFVSATDAATLGIGVPVDAATGIVTPIAISDVSNPWDQGRHEGEQDGDVANYLAELTADRGFQVVVAVEALTDGTLYLFAEYVIGA